MKLFLLPLLLVSTSLFAFDPYEDTEENLADQEELNRSAPNLKNRNGTWVYAFELMLPDGTSRVLSESNRDLLVKPASTMKLFPGWAAYKLSAKTDSYLGTMLKTSSNPMADSTLRAIGGTKALKAFYKQEGLELNSTNFIQADGSGLSYSNKTNCSSQIDLLKLMYRDPSFDQYKTLLARPGQEGTLKKRLLSLKGKLFAKTGTLKRTASLTGIVETNAGTMLFCVLTDYLPSAASNFRPKIDAMVLQNVQSAKKRRY